uniref:Uncharacterized protein n=1 Tax=Xenopus tropicalis TaxID=8364 RepID=A0A1B8Y3A8_XENTR
MVYRLYSPLIVPAPPHLHLVQTYSTPTNGIPALLSTHSTSTPTYPLGTDLPQLMVYQLYSPLIVPAPPLGTDLLYPNLWYTGFTLHSLYQHPHISTWYRPTLPQPMVYRLYSPLIVPAPPYLHLIQTYSTPTNGIPALLSTHCTSTPISPLGTDLLYPNQCTSTPTSPLGTDLLYPNQWYTGFTLHS